MAGEQAVMDLPDQDAPETLSKGAFAQHIGVVAGRVTQMIAQGLPVEANGRINIAAGVAWVDANIDPARRRARVTDPANLRTGTARSERDTAEARIAQLKAGKLAGQLLDRDATLAAIEANAKAHRDAWLGWVHRSAPEVARELGCDIGAATRILDRLVRDQLSNLSQHPIREVTP